MRCKIPERDLAQRLDNTICRYDGKPVHVMFTGGNSLELTSLSNKKIRFTIQSDDPLFDISTIPMGFLQSSPVSVVYCRRRPIRAWKQAVSPDNIEYTFISKEAQEQGIPPLSSAAFENMILGNYPDVNHALEVLFSSSDRNMEVAISRDIALLWKHKLQLTYVFFKKEEVGFIVKNTNTVIVPDNENGWIVSKYLSNFNWKVK